MPGSKVTVEAGFKQIVAEPEVPAFADVPADAYYADAVAWAVKEGITTGTGTNTFSPDLSCTRAQMVTFLWRANGSPVVNYAMSFTDVPADAYYAEAIRWAVSEGITTGTTATTFSPNAMLTRGQTVTFLWRANGSPAVSGSNFGDVASDVYYANAVAWAVSEDITSGLVFCRRNYFAINSLILTLIAKYPDDYNVVDLYATHLIRGGEIEQALGLYKSFIGMKPDILEAYNQVIGIETFLNRPDSVTKYSDMALARFPDNMDILLGKGDARLGTNDAAGAVRTFREAYRAAKDDSTRSVAAGKLGGA